MYRNEKKETDKKCTCFKDALERYCALHQLTYAQFAKRIGSTEDTVKGWMRKNNRSPHIDILYGMKEKLGITFDELLRGVPTPNIDACNRTGLSVKAIENLARIKEDHEKNPEEHRYLMPLLDTILRDNKFLGELEHRVFRLVYWEVQNAGMPDAAIDFDVRDGIEYALTRSCLSVVKDFVTANYPDAMQYYNQKEIEKMAADVADELMPQANCKSEV